MSVETTDLINRGRVDLGPLATRPLSAFPAEVGGVLGGGKIPPRRPTGFFGAGGVFPGDNEFESLEDAKVLKARFVGIWGQRLAEPFLPAARKADSDLVNVLKNTGLSDYGQVYLPLVAVAAFLKGNAPGEFLSLELLVMEETFDQRKRSARAELNLLNHLIEHGEDFLKENALREEMIQEWTEDLFTSRA